MARNAVEIDDGACIASEHDGENGLCHGDEAEYVGVEHGGDVCWRDVGALSHAA